MKNLVKTIDGYRMFFDVLRNYMDEDICEDMNYNWCDDNTTEQNYYDEYLKRHNEKYSEDFIVN